MVSRPELVSGRWRVLQKERYEMKYILPESAVPALRSFVRAYLSPDEHVNGDGLNSYQVYTLYLDAPSLVLCRQTQQGLRNRFKLRVRWYDPSPSAPAFLEIKQRTNDFIHKLRAEVTKQEMQRVVGGSYLSLADRLKNNGTTDVIGEFCERRDRLVASEIMLVTYTREAYESSLGNHVRVTFDRDIWGRVCGLGKDLPAGKQHGEVSRRRVVLEIKFTKQMPGWTHDLVQAFQLQRVSFPKYVACVEALGLSNSPDTTHF